ncbi:MAG TPA: cupin domain-containing protein [Thermoanaerobaculia bacterium]|jgi:ribosomal protein L16 Arg81 hydroxylase|nr:cupin domain-containing protein [Thermoanaerobaculia bacterium]
MTTALESLLDPIDPIEFREQYYGKKPLLIRGNPKKFADLFTWDDLNRLLNALPYPNPHVSTVVPRTRIETETPTSLLEECRAGSALILSQLHLLNPKVGELVRALEAETGEPMAVSLVQSQAVQTAFALHFDRQDVFALHLDGRKGWRVYDWTVEKPILVMEEKPESPPSHPIMEFEMSPGDVLYIPRGCWHQALAQSGPSMHLSLIMAARTGIDFLSWLIDELRKDVRFRHELPLTFAEEAADVREARLREHAAALGDALVSRFHDEETIRSFIRHCIVSDRDVHRIKLPVQMLEAPGAQLHVRHFSRPARQRFVLDDVPAEDKITLSVWGHTLPFSKSAKPLVEFIVSRTAFAYEEAQAHAGELTDEGIWEVLDPLLREGIVDAADGG